LSGYDKFTQILALLITLPTISIPFRSCSYNRRASLPLSITLDQLGYFVLFQLEKASIQKFLMILSDSISNLVDYGTLFTLHSLAY
jgi:hypothetical protein